MTVHQIAFRLDDEIPYEASVLELLKSYPHGSSHQTAKALVSVYAKQGLTHPGVNPQAAQDYYQQPATRQEPLGYTPPIVDSPSPVEEGYIEPPAPMIAEGLGAIEIDYGAL